MSKIFMCGHGGSENHGCEAIVRSTTSLLTDRRISLISTEPEQDFWYGLDRSCDLIRETDDPVDRRVSGFVPAYLRLKLFHDFIPMEKLRYRKSFGMMQEGDVCLAAGGDNYCYDDYYRYILMHELAQKQGTRTVLWGCSVEPERTHIGKIRKDLSSYDLIEARESISYEALHQVNPRTKLTADPAFGLEMTETALPEGFVPGRTVALNISPMVVARENLTGMAMKNCCALVKYLLEHTDFTIALIPHVIWNDNDDRIVLRKIRDAFADSGQSERIIFVDDCDCRRLKYIIAKCRFFVGARTHASIAAYSTNVPSLVIGYSVKSRGIARDLFGSEEGYVVPVGEMNREEMLKDAFVRIMKNEDPIRNKLEETVPQMKQRARQAGQDVENLCQD